MILPESFDIAALEAIGFAGWPSLLNVGEINVPSARGVYVVTYPRAGRIAFSPISCGGWYQGDPALPIETLTNNWIAGCDTVYIGKAGNLGRRLRQFAQFGYGKAIGHWGGRAIWQLPEPIMLTIGWLETPDHREGTVESALLQHFKGLHGRRPFANLRD